MVRRRVEQHLGSSDKEDHRHADRIDRDRFPLLHRHGGGYY